MKRPNRRRVRQRTRALRQTISAMDFVASGTLHTRMKVCGRRNCHCAVDPNARHGPYHEWSRRQNQRLLHSIITEEQAKLIAEAIANHRTIQELLARWEQETAAEILNSNRDADA